MTEVDPRLSAIVASDVVVAGHRLGRMRCAGRAPRYALDAFLSVLSELGTEAEVEVGWWDAHVREDRDECLLYVRPDWESDMRTLLHEFLRAMVRTAAR